MDMKNFILLLVTIITVNRCFSQNDNLSGNIYILSCFVSDGKDSWSLNEKNDMLAKVDQALKWISKSGDAYGKDVVFEHGSFGLDQDIVINNIERGRATGNEDNTMIRRVLEKIGYGDQIQFDRWVKTNTKNREAKVLLFVKGIGNAYCIACPYNNSGDCTFIEGAVLYEKYWSSRPLATGSIAHELLHTFGAWDFYHNYEQSLEQESKAKKMFPNSIMLKIEYDINKSNVDELTAWLVGWNRKEKDWYWWFKPQTN